MKKLHFSLAAIFSPLCAGHREISWGRGFGGMHGGLARRQPGGARPGGISEVRHAWRLRAARPGGNSGVRDRPATSGADSDRAESEGRPNFGGIPPEGTWVERDRLAFGAGPGGNFGGAHLGKIYGGARPGGQFSDANRPGAGGLGANRFPGAGANGFGHKEPAAGDMTKRPDRSQLSKLLGMPSDGGMHKLAASHVPVDKTAIAGMN